MVAGAGTVEAASSRRRQLAALSLGRAFALASWLALTGAYLSVFYHITDIAGGGLRLALVVAGAFVLATLVAEYIPVRTGLAVGAGAVVAGSLVYMLGAGQFANVSVRWLVDNLAYLTGVTVLSYLRVDLWAVSMAPGPVFLSWYLVLRREYDLAAVAGGAVLGFFVLTGDASEVVTLLGTVGLLGLLGFGAIDEADVTWDQFESVGLVLALSVAAARFLQIVPDGGSSEPAIGGPGSGRGGGVASAGGSGGAPSGTLENALVDSGERLDVGGSISLSPKVRFLVDADDPEYWLVTAYDRYTGEGWVRTGESTAVGAASAPPGETRRLEQTVTMRGELYAVPAAWKPVGIDGFGEVRLDSQGGLQPLRALDEGDSYTAVSQVPDYTADELRRAGQSYPDEIVDRYLRLPESTPARVRRRTEEVIEDAPTAYDAATAVAEYLRSSKEYSLSVGLPDGDVADRFLFEMEQGYCMHFATTMVVMLRSIGIPARFAVGYTTGQRDADDRFVVRGFNSHAWVAAFLPGVEWVRFDPTPASGRAAARSETLQEARETGVEGIDAGGTGERTLTRTAIQGQETTTTISAGGINGSVPPREQGPTPPDLGDVVGGERGLNGTNQAGPGTTPPLRAGSANGSNATGANASQGPAPDRARDRLTILAVGVSLVLGARQLGVLDRVLDTVKLWYQPATDEPSADVERAFERVESALARETRPRASGETPRQYLEAVTEGADGRHARLSDLYERARHAGQVSREEADEAITIADALVRERSPI